MYSGSTADTEVILVTMGGDGSLGCFIDDISTDHYIAQNIFRVVFVPLPYGTGNDLSRSLGWGRKEGAWAQDLEQLGRYMAEATREKFTVWDVHVYAQQVQGYSRQGLVKISEPKGTEREEHFRKSLCCYINFGLDSVISNGKGAQNLR